MRRLNTAVVAGGVVYPAGTAATPELEEIVTDPKHWVGESAPVVEEPVAPEPETQAEDVPNPEPHPEPEPVKPTRKRAARKPAKG